jgi:tRNA threonylcarbamoyladenosine biosynthesis protein TsaB
LRILAIDTATEACSAALLLGDAVIGRYEESGKSHAQQILGMVNSLLAEGGVSLSMLDGIAVSIGPGAFTGVRIGVAVAQGLAFGADLRVVPVTTLEALALQAVQRGAALIIACLDARMGEVYWGCFAADAARGVSARGEPRVGAPELVAPPLAAARYRGIGRGFAAYPALAALPGLDLDAADGLALPNAREMARLGALRLAAGEGVAPTGLRPLYLRDKVALTEVERRQAKGAARVARDN